MIKMLINCFFKKYDYIFVSKCIVGGSIAIHFLNRVNKNCNIYFYIIGNGYSGFKDKKIYFEDITKCEKIIVESDIVKESMVLKGNSEEKIHVFPCLKPIYNIDVLEKNYIKKQPLKLIYFSRINPDKGLGDLIYVLIELNKDSTNPLFYLDIAGGVSDEPGIKEFNELIIEKCNQYSFLNYLGMSLRIENEDSYLKLQHYDLHVFPSRFTQECAPGSILDMFIAGVPTLSSKYPSYKTLLNEENSVLFNQNNIEDLKEKLMYVYNNADKILNTKRELSHREYFKYTEDKFLTFLNAIGFE